MESLEKWVSILKKTVQFTEGLDEMGKSELVRWQRNSPRNKHAITLILPGGRRTVNKKVVGKNINRDQAKYGPNHKTSQFRNNLF